jgi:hypothetical protein
MGSKAKARLRLPVEPAALLLASIQLSVRAPLPNISARQLRGRANILKNVSRTGHSQEEIFSIHSRMDPREILLSGRGPKPYKAKDKGPPLEK